MRTCKKCGKQKDARCFDKYTTKRQKTDYRKTCKTCSSANDLRALRRTGGCPWDEALAHKWAGVSIV